MPDLIKERVSDKKMTPDEKDRHQADIGKIPDILLDNTDRNRNSSPFALPATGSGIPGATGSSHTLRGAEVTQYAAIAEELIQLKRVGCTDR